MKQNKEIKQSQSDVMVECLTQSDSSLAPPFMSRKFASTTGSESYARNIQTDDSFQEVVEQQQNRRSRREDKQLTKEKLHEEKLTKMLGGLNHANNNNSSLAADEESEENRQVLENSLTAEDEQSNSDDNTRQIGLTKKKQQYLEQAIVDRGGAYKYDADPQAYKKARKRLQNRESAVRSRMKKRQEVEVLEEQIRELAEQKAAVDSANDELKRQNKYWEDLFAKQQLQRMVPIPVNSSGSASGFNSQSEFTFSEQSECGADSSLEPSYVALRMASDNGAKRQKRSDGSSLQTGGLFELDRSHELERDLHDATYNKYDDIDVMAEQTNKNTNGDELKRQFSIEQFAQRQNNNQLALDDFFLERDQQQHRSSGLFFGLAMVFGAVGIMTSMGAQIDDTVGNSVQYNSGMRLRGAGDNIRTDPTSSLVDGDIDDELMLSKQSFEVDPNSPYQNIYTAFILILQAMRSLSVFTQVSFAFSFVFLLIGVYYFILPLVGLLKSSSQPTLRKSSRSSTRQQAEQQSSSSHKQSSSSKRQKNSQSTKERQRNQKSPNSNNRRH